MPRGPAGTINNFAAGVAGMSRDTWVSLLLCLFIGLVSWVRFCMVSGALPQYMHRYRHKIWQGALVTLATSFLYWIELQYFTTRVVEEPPVGDDGREDPRPRRD